MLMKKLIKNLSVFCATASIIGSCSGFADNFIPHISDSKALIASAVNNEDWRNVTYTNSYGQWDMYIDTYSRDYSYGTLQLRSYKPKSSGSFSIIIPDRITINFKDANGISRTISNCRVTSIHQYAFSYKEQILSVVIPDSVEHIWSQAFYNCSNLQTVSFAKKSSLYKIDSYAFDKCSSLKTIQFPTANTDSTKGLSFMDAFKGCDAIEEISGSLYTFSYGNRDTQFTAETSQFHNLKRVNGKNIVENGRLNSDPVIREIASHCNYGDIASVDQAMKTMIEDELQKIRRKYPFTTDLEKITAIHDWVRDKVSYAKLSDNRTPDNCARTTSEYSWFFQDKIICNSYSFAFAYLAYYAGLECYPVANYKKNHAWNVVKLGGQFYNIDVCYDDLYNHYGNFLFYDNSYPDRIREREMNETQFPAFNKVSSSPKCETNLADINGDTNIDNIDLDAMRQLCVGDGASNYNKYAADLNFDGRISMDDMIILMNFINWRGARIDVKFQQYLANR